MPPIIQQNLLIENHSCHGQMVRKVVSGEGRSAAYYQVVKRDPASATVEIGPLPFDRAFTLISNKHVTISIGQVDDILPLSPLRNRVCLPAGRPLHIYTDAAILIFRVDVSNWVDAGRLLSDDEICAAILIRQQARRTDPNQYGLNFSAVRGLKASLLPEDDIRGGQSQVLLPSTDSCVQDTVEFELTPSGKTGFTLHNLQDTILTSLVTHTNNLTIDVIDFREHPGTRRVCQSFSIPQHEHWIITIPAGCGYHICGRGYVFLRAEYRLLAYKNPEVANGIVYGKDFQQVHNTHSHPVVHPPELRLPAALLRRFARNDFQIAQGGVV